MHSEERRRVRQILSEAFIDQPLDAASIARRIAGHAPAELEAIFFSEVAPACWSNLASPVPPIWTAFDDDWLQDCIEQLLHARRTSRLRRLGDALLIRWLRWQYAGEWREIACQLS